MIKKTFFLVEGDKMVLEAISSNFKLELIAATNLFLSKNEISKLAANILIECSADELKKASLLQNPQHALAIAKIPSYSTSIDQLSNTFSLALDCIQDPGNLGTIIRMADWFGIEHVFCTKNTVDCYNPKAIQASMGAVFRVQVHYLDLAQFLGNAIQSQISIYGTFLTGNNIYQSELSSTGILVMGNEGQGISPEIEEKIKHKIHIPSFTADQSGSESLNVATATAICCSEFKRRAIGK